MANTQLNCKSNMPIHLAGQECPAYRTNYDRLGFLTQPTNEYFIREALKEAQKAYNEDEVPVGAIAVYKNKIIAKAHNQIIKLKDPTAHAEIIAMRKASKKIQNERLNGVYLYVTLEPCLMCVGAMILARIECLVYGADDKKTGAINLLKTIKSNHNFKIINGILAEDSSDLLKHFFRSKRN